MNRPQNVGIQFIEIYFPQTYINQAELEIYDNVPKGKYTIGLGQQNMSFAYEFEDINSISLTAVSNLLQKYRINPKSIGRLEVGTETLIDKSKSVKTVLMRLFEQKDIEGVTSINACYGGTNALFNTIQWMQSDAWDGRLGIVVCADVAVYAKGPARPTGGVGAVAMLIAPEAAFVLERNRASYINDTYDFYKPNLSSEYPIVDGQLSIGTYLTAIDNCYQQMCNKDPTFNVNQFDYYCFHSPFHKMVQKSFLRLIMNDINTGKLEPVEGVNMSNFNEKQNLLMKQYEQLWKQKVIPSCYLSQQLGNIYTGSLYAGLISLIDTQRELIGKRIVMFSYGSGCASSMFVLRCQHSTTEMHQIQNISQRIQSRIKIPCQQYTDILLDKENKFNKPSQVCTVDLSKLTNNTYYLVAIDDKYRRQYAQHIQLITPNQTTSINNDVSVQRLELIKNQITVSKQPSKSEYSQIWAGFYKKTLPERLDQIKLLQNINVEHFKDGGLSLQNANLMIENCIGRIAMPIGLGLNFLINGTYYSVPMAIEEPSVIAAASSAAKVIAELGSGFQAFSTRPVMMGQIQLLDVQNPSKIECLIDANKGFIIRRGNQQCDSMVKRGGGIEDVKVRYLGDGQASVDVYINVCDSMGANLVNTVVEHLAPLIEEITSCRTGIKILTNLCMQRKVSASFSLSIEKMAYKGFSGAEVAKMMLEAYRFAQLDIYRAVTHNKGIINGIEAVCNATGQDTRAVSSSLHGYAAFNGKYIPISKYYIDGTNFIGEITLPISVGTQGGVIPSNPLYQQVLQILDFPDSQKLAEIMVCVGLASNFSALRALSVEGIQKGHMNLHARNLSLASGIPEHLVEDAVQFMKNRNSYKKETALEFLRAYTLYKGILQVRGKQQSHALCTFSGEFQLEGSQERVDLHIVFDCHSSEPIHLHFSPESEINSKIFGQKGESWLRNLFSILHSVRLDQEMDGLPTKKLTVKLKLLAVLINLLSFNMLTLNFQYSKQFITSFQENHEQHCLEQDISLRYGLSLLGELMRIFQYNLDQSIGDQQLKAALQYEQMSILNSHIQCFELWEGAKQKQFNLEAFWASRKKRLSCTMMLLCDCINLKLVDEQILGLVNQLGDVYEMEITLARDTSKWRASAILSDPNIYTYWLLMKDKLMQGEQPQTINEFKQESSGMLESRRLSVQPMLPTTMSHLSHRATMAVNKFYGSNKAKL